VDKDTRSIQPVLLITVIGVCLAAVFAPLSSVFAATVGLPPRPTPDVNVPASDSYILLRAAAAPSGAWSVVEWKDAAGNWHVVDGWQGALDEDGVKTWWVAPIDRGKWPFRWVVYDRPGGHVWGTSAEFMLPTRNHWTTVIKVPATQ
jgi:hypothetical protein